MKLKYSEAHRNSIKGILDSIHGELLDIDYEKALQFCNWYLTKTIYYKKHLNSQPLHKLPDKMTKGDIVLVKLGINIGSELSDVGEDSEGHFGLIWGQQGQQFIIIPLTKKEQPLDNKYGIKLGIIDGLPKKKNSEGILEDVITYAKIDAIRSVHLRRLHRIKGTAEGKVTIIDENILQKISSIFDIYFGNNINKVDN